MSNDTQNDSTEIADDPMEIMDDGEPIQTGPEPMIAKFDARDLTGLSEYELLQTALRLVGGFKDVFRGEDSMSLDEAIEHYTDVLNKHHYEQPVIDKITLMLMNTYDINELYGEPTEELNQKFDGIFKGMVPDIVRMMVNAIESEWEIKIEAEELDAIQHVGSIQEGIRQILMEVISVVPVVNNGFGSSLSLIEKHREMKKQEAEYQKAIDDTIAGIVEDESKI